MKKTVAFHNLGCKVNAYELEAMQQILEKAGYQIVPFEPGADVYIINTCTVTNIADRKSRQMLHKAKKMNPNAVVVAVGCYVQADLLRLEADEAVDLIVGNNRKKDIVSLLEAYDKTRDRQECVININQTKEYEPLRIDSTAEHVRAYIKVQDGCNQFCTYCIIPYTRGRVRSRSMSDVKDEVIRLAQKGYQEVVLTGIHLSSYGVDFKDSDHNLLSLIQSIHQVDGITRIRLGSLEPRIITEEFVQTLSGLWKVCPHFHLSLQSGCQETLERMNRRYTADEYREKCQILRKYYENPALTTDVIVGFPQESLEEFRESYEFVKEIQFYETHIFKYSRRKGTKADKMEGQIPEQEKTRRSEQMIALGQERAFQYENSFLGGKLDILLEEEIQIDGKSYLTGHSREYIKAAVPAEGGWKINDCVCMIPERFLKDRLLTGTVTKFSL